MNLLTRLFALHFDRSFSRKGWRQLAWLFGVIVTVFLLIYLVSFAFIFPEPSLKNGPVLIKTYLWGVCFS